MNGEQVNKLLELGQTNPVQFKKELQDATERKIDVQISWRALMELPDESIIAYIASVSTDYQTVLNRNALYDTAIQSDDSKFKRQYLLLKHFTVDLALAISNSIFYKAMRCLTFEELGCLHFPIKVHKGDALDLTRCLYNAVMNSDTRVFDFYYQRYVTSVGSDIQIDRQMDYWKSRPIVSRSAFKLIKLELANGGWTKFWNVETFRDWSLLGYFAPTASNPTARKLIVDLAHGDGKYAYPRVLKQELKDIVAEGERALACLNGRLPRVLVDLVLQYLI